MTIHCGGCTSSNPAWNQIKDRLQEPLKTRQDQQAEHLNPKSLKERLTQVVDKDGDGEVTKDDLVKFLTSSRTLPNGKEQAGMPEVDAQKLADQIAAGKDTLSTHDIFKAIKAQHRILAPGIQKAAPPDNISSEVTSESADDSISPSDEQSVRHACQYQGHRHYDKPAGGTNERVNVLV